MLHKRSMQEGEKLQMNSSAAVRAGVVGIQQQRGLGGRFSWVGGHPMTQVRGARHRGPHNVQPTTGGCNHVAVDVAHA